MSDSTQKNFLEKLFKLKENNTNIKTEIIAGITTVAEDLTTMNDKELNNLYWLMQGMKIARGCRE